MSKLLRNKLGGLALLIVAVALILAGCGAAEKQPGDEGTASPTDGNKGGTIRAALSADSGMFDMMLNARSATVDVAQNIFEQLFAVDEKFLPQPMLADSYEVSDDALEYTIKLRQGIKFHDGSDFDSTDAKASLERWFVISTTGGLVAKDIASVDTPDPSTLVLKLKTRRYSLITDLAWFQQAAIMLPSTIAEAAGEKPLAIDQIVGTGPYKMGEYKPGQNVTVVRYADYKPVAEFQGGLAGKKEAFADEIKYIFVPDAAQRLNGLKTGQWDWVEEVDANDLKVAMADSSITVTRSANGNVNTLLLNHAPSSVFSSLKARQALNMMLDRRAIATATFGPPEFWEPLTSSWAAPWNSASYSEVGKEVFDKHDPQEAKKLFAEVGVTADKPIRIISSKSYPQMYQWAVIIQEELAQIGLKATIATYEYPTADALIREQPDAWDLSMTFFVPTWVTPGQILWLSPGWPGSYENPKVAELSAQWQSSTTPDEAHAVIDDLHRLVWSDLPVIILGMQDAPAVYSAKLKLNPSFDTKWSTVLWNAQVEK